MQATQYAKLRIAAGPTTYFIRSTPGPLRDIFDDWIKWKAGPNRDEHQILVHNDGPTGKPTTESIAVAMSQISGMTIEPV